MGLCDLSHGNTWTHYGVASVGWRCGGGGRVVTKLCNVLIRFRQCVQADTDSHADRARVKSKLDIFQTVHIQCALSGRLLY